LIRSEGKSRYNAILHCVKVPTWVEASLSQFGGHVMCTVFLLTYSEVHANEWEWPMGGVRNCLGILPTERTAGWLIKAKIVMNKYKVIRRVPQMDSKRGSKRAGHTV
jgi:hypothetical protein